MQRFNDLEDNDSIDRPRIITRAEQEQSGLLPRTTYVPATPATPVVRRDQIPIPPTQVIEVPARVEGERIIHEQTSPIQRAIAVVISAMLWGVLSAFAGMVIIWATTDDPVTVIILVIIAISVTGYMFFKFDCQAHEHSPAGVERQKNSQQHTERMYELQRRFDLHEKMVDKLLGMEGNEEC